MQEPIISESYKAAGTALEIIPRTLLENCGADIIRVQTQLRAKHAGGIIGAFLSDTAAGGGPRRLPFSSSSSPPSRAPPAAGANTTWGIDGEKGVLADMKDTGIWEPFAVKSQTIKTAVESAAMLLRIDEIVSGTHKKEKKAPGVSDREKAAQAEGVDGAAE